LTITGNTGGNGSTGTLYSADGKYNGGKWDTQMNKKVEPLILKPNTAIFFLI
jgi:hypothetical protein